MKSSFRLIATMILAVMLGTSTTGCDSGQDIDQPTTPLPSTRSGEPEQAPGKPGGAGSQAWISDAELEKAAAAFAEIQEINQELERSVQQTQDPNERQRLQLETNKRIVQAAENAGLDFETYNSIMSEIRMNNELNERFQKKVQNRP